MAGVPARWWSSGVGRFVPLDLRNHAQGHEVGRHVLLDAAEGIEGHIPNSAGRQKPTRGPKTEPCQAS